MTEEAFIELALNFAGTEQCKHFNRIGFKIIKKKMFATYLPDNNTANIFLNQKEQKVFCKIDSGIYPVPNKWGENGATTFELDKVPEAIIKEALLSAYNLVLNSKK